MRGPAYPKTGSPAKTGVADLFGIVWIFWRFSGGTSGATYHLIRRRDQQVILYWDQPHLSAGSPGPTPAPRPGPAIQPTHTQPQQGGSPLCPPLIQLLHGPRPCMNLAFELHTIIIRAILQA